MLCVAGEKINNVHPGNVLIGNLPAGSSVEITDDGVITITPARRAMPQLGSEGANLFIIYVQPEKPRPEGAI